MFNKVLIVNQVKAFAKQLDIPLDSLVVTYGAASVLMGFTKETNDIDIYVQNSKVWETIRTKSNGYMSYLPPNGLFPECLVINLAGMSFHFSTVEFEETYQLKDLTVVTPVELLRNRIQLGRLKDMSDILHLRYLRKSLTMKERQRMQSLKTQYNIN